VLLAPFTSEETFKYANAVFGSDPRDLQALSDWLYEKTLGHPYFLAFISRELLANGHHSPKQLWPEIFIRLEREKFQADLAQLSEKDIALLRALAGTEEHEFTPAPFAKKFQHEYFRRLTERGVTHPRGTRSIQALSLALSRIFAAASMLSRSDKNERKGSLRSCAVETSSRLWVSVHSLHGLGQPYIEFHLPANRI